MKRTFALLSALFISTATMAHETDVGALQIIHAHIALPAPGAMAAGGFMDIVNTGTEMERLIGVEVDFAAAQLHQTVVSADGVASMNPVEAIEIPAGATVALEHGGYHVMLMGLTKTLALGDELPGVLIFEHQGRVEIEFKVDPRDGSMDHTAPTN
ncbi:MAG: copper chaperone PCu(A)C [Pseudorhodobacter sp.]|nr:copper chaperone PCu(A)C [Pseudorhodobacter sp.]